jgi:hypothetical protein
MSYYNIPKGKYLDEDQLLALLAGVEGFGVFAPI